MKTRALACRIVSTLIIASCLAIASLAADKPNILFIFGDDAGIDSFGCYGSDRAKSLTPHIDALAKSGTRFERCYSTPLCGPSRCVIMTGRYGFRTGGLTNQTAGNPKNADEPSLAKILKSAGYATGMAGKWRQMGESPGDWGFEEYITDPTASGWFWQKSYTKNGKEVMFDKEVYVPDDTLDFAVDFMRRHKEGPFYFYLSEHLIHGPILRTPDTKPESEPRQLYDDNISYLDKRVGKLMAALDELGLREKTLVLFTTDNGTAPPAYMPQHDPNLTTGKIGGRAMSGRKGQLLEGGSRVPLIANWKGVLPGNGVRNDLIDFSDLLPTFAELAGAKLPEGVKFDGTSFAPQLRGQQGKPRDWIFVQLGAGWYARNDGYKLNEKGELFAMNDAPFVEAPIAADSADAAAAAARKQLQAVLSELNPAGGKTVPAGDDQKAKAAKKAKRQAKKAAEAAKTQ
jgi:arylsulfatase A